jgi:hypothetical protein
MPKHTIEMTSEIENRLLARQVAPYNTQYGVALSLDDWLLLHLKDLATHDELAVTANALSQQVQHDAERALQAAVEAERQRLIAALG